MRFRRRGRHIWLKLNGWGPAQFAELGFIFRRRWCSAGSLELMHDWAIRHGCTKSKLLRLRGGA